MELINGKRKRKHKTQQIILQNCIHSFIPKRLIFFLPFIELGILNDPMVIYDLKIQIGCCFGMVLAGSGILTIMHRLHDLLLHHLQDL